MGRNDLQNFLKNEDPDILCINETKITEDKMDNTIFNSLSKDKYLQFWNCCKVSSGYAGTAIFTKVRPWNVTFDLGIPKHDQEGRTITAEFANFILVACYVPNAGQKLDRLDYRTKEWDPDFAAYLKKLETTRNKCVILCGDLNVSHTEIDIFNAKGNKKSAGFTMEERNGFTNLLMSGFKDSFRELHPKEIKYTYWNMRSNARAENRGWRLDYFVVTPSLMSAINISDTVPDIMGSDHCPIKLILSIDKIVNPNGISSSLTVQKPTILEEEKKVEPKKLQKKSNKEKSDNSEKIEEQKEQGKEEKKDSEKDKKSEQSEENKKDTKKTEKSKKDEQSGKSNENE